MDIHPTGTCFDDAIEMAVELLEKNAHEKLFVVHAILHSPALGLYSHAWLEEKVETGWLVWSRGFINGHLAQWAVMRDEFLKEMNVTDQMTRYSIPEVWENNLSSGTYGPWEDRYRELTSDSKRKRQGEQG